MNGWIESLKDRLDPGVLEKANLEGTQGGDPADFLLGGGHLTRQDLLSSLSAFYDRPSLLLGEYEPEENALAKVPEDVARKFTVMPLFIVRGKIFVATADPEELSVEDYISQLTGLNMETVVTTKGNILESINRYYIGGDRSREKVKIMAGPKAEEKTTETSRSGQETNIEDTSPSVKLVDYLLSTGIRIGASDVHIEACEDSVLLRYRIDGILREYPPPPFDLIRAIVSRIKILSELDVSERRLPQDGRATFNVDGKDFDLRISIIPNIYGESVVIRVLASSTDVKELKDMGFSDAMFKKYTRMISQPHGVVLVTGPTGSGKSTTLYATLKYILTPEKKILTLEDPVEARMKGVTQFQMNSAIGFTFARALRSVLRHDPEVVLLGEIRDQETAEIAIRASLTGHMIYSTLHTNDACSAPTRLIDMGIAGYLVMTSLIGVLSQRLVRRLCAKCKQPIEIEEIHRKTLGITGTPDGATLCRAVGCTDCQNLGYKGRVAIHELLEVSAAIRRLPADRLTSEAILDIARKEGFITLRESALDKWLAGVTSMEEIVKLTVESTRSAPGESPSSRKKRERVLPVKKIYIAEDDPTLINIMKFSLDSMRELDVSFFDNGLDLYRQIQLEPPDAVVTDIILPKLEGLSVSRLIKFDDNYHHIPVMVISSVIDPDIAEQVKKVGADDFLRKPFRPNELREKIQSLLGRAEG